MVPNEASASAQPPAAAADGASPKRAKVQMRFESSFPPLSFAGHNSYNDLDNLLQLMTRNINRQNMAR